jgi:hypothetical protein
VRTIGALRTHVAGEALHLAQEREPHPAVRRDAAVRARNALASAREEDDVDPRVTAPVVVDAQGDDARLADAKPDRPDRRGGRVVA